MYRGLITLLLRQYRIRKQSNYVYTFKPMVIVGLQKKIIRNPFKPKIYYPTSEDNSFQVEIKTVFLSARQMCFQKIDLNTDSIIDIFKGNSFKNGVLSDI
jgi:hypothetical protein